MTALVGRAFARVGRAWRRALLAWYRPHVIILPGAKLRRLGTPYGGWAFCDRGDLYGATVISAGLGEDGSFDVEFAAAYGARVILVDPTPSAIDHFAAITARVGGPAEREYAEGGRQPPDAYSLETITTGQIQIVERALWTEITELDFFAPANPDHVSHSIGNFQHNYATDTPSIRVETTTLQAIMAERGLVHLPLLKLDIEGAEVEVIMQMLGNGMLPGQILVEFDELRRPSRRSARRFRTVHELLTAAGYACHAFDGIANLLYALPEGTHGKTD